MLSCPLLSSALFDIIKKDDGIIFLGFVLSCICMMLHLHNSMTSFLAKITKLQERENKISVLQKIQINSTKTMWYIFTVR